MGLTRSQAVEWSRHGITANAIAPSYFPTEMTETALDNEKMSTRLRTFTPQGRFGQPAELATALLFLCSKASGYVNGTVVPGGRRLDRVVIYSGGASRKTRTPISA